MMKTLTLYQPWASLKACDAKKYETRSWETKYRGPILIHAALKRPPRQEDLDWEVFNAMTTALGRRYGACRYNWHLGGTRMNPDGTDNGFDIPLGSIIAIAELVEYWKITDRYYTIHPNVRDARCIEVGNKKGNVEGDEILFGDWTPGRFAWQFANMTILKKPIPAKGMQRLWNWDETPHLVSIDPYSIGETKIWTPKGVRSGRKLDKTDEDAVMGLEVVA